MQDEEKPKKTLIYWLRLSNDMGNRGFIEETDDYKEFEKEALDMIIGEIF